MMSAKDYVAIAAVFKAEREHWHATEPDAYPDALDAVARELARVCRAGNPLFDTDRFLAACAVNVPRPGAARASL